MRLRRLQGDFHTSGACSEFIEFNLRGMRKSTVFDPCSGNYAIKAMMHNHEALWRIAQQPLTLKLEPQTMNPSPLNPRS